MKIALLAGLLLATAACGAYQFPSGGGKSPNTGSVNGRVLAVPCAPVERVDSPCAGRPVAGLEIDYADGQTKQAATTDSNGDYAIQLPAGTWKVSMNSYMRIISGPTSVTIAAGSSVVADYLVDSGIRVPAPQQ